MGKPGEGRSRESSGERKWGSSMKAREDESGMLEASDRAGEGGRGALDKGGVAGPVDEGYSAHYSGGFGEEGLGGGWKGGEMRSGTV